MDKDDLQLLRINEDSCTLEGRINFLTGPYTDELNQDLPSTFTFALYPKNGELESRLFSVTHEVNKHGLRFGKMSIYLNQVTELNRALYDTHLKRGETYEMVIGVEEWQLALLSLNIDIGRCFFFVLFNLRIVLSHNCNFWLT